MESAQQQLERHDDEALSIAVISSQVCSLKELIMEKFTTHDLKLDSIKEQTTKTNGHVAEAFREIEERRKDIDTLNGWKNKIIGGLIISNIVIVPLLMWLIIQHMRP